jgi:hypothetical protein
MGKENQGAADPGNMRGKASEFNAAPPGIDRQPPMGGGFLW